MGGQRPGGRRLDVVLRARRDVVEIDRRPHRVRDAAEVADQTVLRAGDEIRGDDGDPGKAEPVELLRQKDRLVGGRRARVGHDGNAAAGLVGHGLEQPHLLVEGQRGEVAVGPGRHDAVSGRHLAADLGTRGVEIEGFGIVEAGDEGDESG